MSDKNKENIENKQEENLNKPEGNKNWWKSCWVKTQPTDYNIVPKNWIFSSFHKFVKQGYYDIEWCNLEDKNCINSLDYE